MSYIRISRPDGFPEGKLYCKSMKIYKKICDGENWNDEDAIKVKYSDGTECICSWQQYVDNPKNPKASRLSAPPTKKPVPVSPSHPAPVEHPSKPKVIVTANEHRLIPSSCVMSPSDLQMLGIPMDPMTQATFGLGLGSDISESSGIQFLNGGGIMTWHDKVL